MGLLDASGGGCSLRTLLLLLVRALLALSTGRVRAEAGSASVQKEASSTVRMAYSNNGLHIHKNETFI